MRSYLRRISGLIARYRIDRRLPPSVSDLISAATRLRRDDALARRRAAMRDVLGGDVDVRHSSIARMGHRRIRTAGDLDMPLFDLGHRNAQRIVEVLRSGGFEPFIVERRGDGFEFGIPLVDRKCALGLLVAALAASATYVAWEDGRSSGVCEISEAGRSRRVQRARTWSVFTAFSWGEDAVGQEAATVITFWDMGTSGQLEKIGTRGQDRFHEDSKRIELTVDGRQYPGVATFPVGRNFEEFDGEVDVVYTWVDGSDPVWQANFDTWRAAEPADRPTAAFDPARFRNRDELRYSLRSVWAYCGWVRNIYVVTSGQVPAWLASDDRVRVVTHSEILPAEALPTFNSHSIEAALHHIDGLSEHFIYLNDDVFIGRSLRPDAFFTSNGLAKVFQSDARVQGAESGESLAVDTAALRGRELLAEGFGRVMSCKPLHAPFALRRSVLDRIDAEFDDHVDRTIRSRFRSADDLSIAASFAGHFGLAIGKSVLGDVRSEYVHIESGRLSWSLDRVRLGDDIDTFCLNETADVDADHGRREARIRNFFACTFPIAAPWEQSS